jgi:serine/threonine protein kinase
MVYVAKHKDSNNEYAIKEIYVKDVKDSNFVKKSIELVQNFPPNPYVVKYFSPLESTRYVYILMEYCRGGSLEEFIQKRHGHPLQEPV